MLQISTIVALILGPAVISCVPIAEDIPDNLSPVTSNNLLANPSFEGSLAPWTPTDTLQNIVNTPKHVRTGGSALQIRGKGNNLWYMNWVGSLSQDVSVTAGESYTLQLWAKVDTAKPCELSVSLGPLTNAKVEKQRFGMAEREYSKLSTRVTAPSKSTGPQKLWISTSCPGWTILYLDDVSLVPVRAGSTQSTSSAAVTSPPSPRKRQSSPTATTTSSPSLRTNVISNPSFETEFSSWTWIGHSGVSVSLNTKAKTGQTALRAHRENSRDPWLVVLQQHSIRVLPGRTYNFTMWAQQSIPRNCMLNYVSFASQGHPTGLRDVAIPPSYAPIARQVRFFSSVAANVTMKIAVSCSVTGSRGDFNLDDISLVLA